MIRVEGLCKRFGRCRAVRDVTFRVAPGEAVALWGPNGAGKTTIMRCVLGLLPFRGRIRVAGLDVARRGKAVRRLIGYVPQELALYDDFRVLEMVRFFGRLKRVPGSSARSALERVGLESVHRRRVGQLSGGMKQRLALATALLADPPVLLLDEPTSSLDAKGRGTLNALLGDLNAQGKTMLFTSHRADDVRRLGQRVVLMEQGRLERECPAGLLERDSQGGSTLTIHLEQETLDRAVGLLRREGFAVTRNGQSLDVHVQPDDRAAPIHALARGKIIVRKFEVSAAPDALAREDAP